MGNIVIGVGRIFTVLAILISSIPPDSAAYARTPTHRGPGDNAGLTQPRRAARQLIVKLTPFARARQAAAGRAIRVSGGQILSYVRETSGEAGLYELPGALSDAEASAALAALNASLDVEYASRNDVRHFAFTPDDSFYGQQWDFEPPGTDAYGIDAEGAWDVVTGSLDTRIAVLDTGALFAHPDLVGRFAPGYDMVSDTSFSNDGDGRDNSAQDPGDFGASCGSSSWHGSHVAGTIAASGNNDIGIAGINWVSKVVPVRVLGQCGGGEDADIIDGMRWAGGLHVAGAPDNPNPARVLNISLGGLNSGCNPALPPSAACDCPAAYLSAINDLAAIGVTIVVAAGNANYNAQYDSPGNCPGVITVAATTLNGLRASYSNYGATVEIAAPGGDSADPIWSTVSTDATVPVNYGYAGYRGTSMATPHVAGVISLMLSLRPSLGPSAILALLRASATSFPSGSGCNTSNCGAGIVNARQAVLAVQALGPMDKQQYLPLLRIGATAAVNTGHAGGPRRYSPAHSVESPLDSNATWAWQPCKSWTVRKFMPLVLVGGGADAVGVLQNGGFENSDTPWIGTSTSGFRMIYSATDSDWVSGLGSQLLPNSGMRAVWFRSCSGVDTQSSLSQRLLLPAGAHAISYYSVVISAEPICAPDRDIATVLINGIQVEQQLLCAPPVAVAPVWLKHTIAIPTGVTGPITLRFEFASDFEAGSNWLIDDVAVE